MNDVSYLKQKAQEWAGKVVNLYHMQVPPEYEAKKRALLSSAKKIKDSIEYLTGPLAYLSAMNSMNLGFIPVVVGVVGVTGAIAAVTYWITDYNKFLVTVEERNKLIAAGLSPQQAANIVSQNHDKESFFGFKIDSSKIVLGLGGIGLVYFIAKKQGWF